MFSKSNMGAGLFPILSLTESKPLQNWDKQVKNGHIKKLIDNDLQSYAIEIIGANVNNNYISCPLDSQSLGIKLPFLVILVKNLKKYFAFEYTVLDDKGIKRKFRSTNFQSNSRVKQTECSIPMKLEEGWNQIVINLSDFTFKAFGTNFVELVKFQINANCRIKKIYFSDQHISNKKLPPEYKVFFKIEEEGALDNKISDNPQDASQSN